MSNIDSRKVLHGGGNFSGSDEAYTPLYGVKPIIKYIPSDAVIWCPFDTSESEFVKEISKTHKVIYSHIDSNQDFFTYESHEHWDMIISNPPFKCKKCTKRATHRDSIRPPMSLDIRPAMTELIQPLCA